MGVYGSNGFLVQGGSKLVSEGAPLQMMNRFVRYHSVQEQANANRSGGTAGLAPGDTIGAINNLAFSVAALTWVGGRAEPVTLGVRRGHHDLSFTLTPAPRERIQSIRWNGTAAQSERIGEWLHQKEIDLASGKEVDLGFSENFHGVEIVV